MILRGIRKTSSPAPPRPPQNKKGSTIKAPKKNINLHFQSRIHETCFLIALTSTLYFFHSHLYLHLHLLSSLQTQRTSGSVDSKITSIQNGKYLFIYQVIEIGLQLFQFGSNMHFILLIVLRYMRFHICKLKTKNQKNQNTTLI